MVIFSPDIRKHRDHIKEVVGLVAHHGLKIKIRKCDFAKEKIDLLGQVVSKQGVRVDSKKVDVIKNTPQPSTQTELRSFLGIAGYYRRFIRNFGSISAPMHAATSRKANFEWTAELNRSFEKLKVALTSPPVLAFPDFEKPFVDETDASTVAVGAALSQRNSDDHVHPIQFASRTLTSTEQNYSVCEREALAVVFGLRKFRLYLLSTEPFLLLTDQQALKTAFRKKDIHGRLARWLDFLAEYDFTI